MATEQRTSESVLEAARALLADVRRRYPGEELRCPYMRALDDACNAVATTVQLHAQPGFAVFASAFGGRIRFENFTPHRLEVTVRIVPLLENPT